MAENNDPKWQEFHDQVIASLDQIGVDLTMLGDDTGDLVTIVAIMERLDEVKDLAATTREEGTFQFAFGFVEIFAGILCERFDDAVGMLHTMANSLQAMKSHVEAVLDNPASPSDSPLDAGSSAVLKSIFGFLEVPVVELPTNGVEAEIAEEAPIEEEASPAPVDGVVDEGLFTTGLPAVFDDVDLYKEFAFECSEHLETIEESILELENTPEDLDLINAIFRPIHSMKGGAGFLSLLGMSKIAHSTETLLDHCRKENLAVDNRVVDVCLRSADALKQMIANLTRAVESPDANSFTCDLIAIGPIRADIDLILASMGDNASAPKVPSAATASSPSPVAVPVSATTPAPLVIDPDADLSDEKYASFGLPSDWGDDDDIALYRRFVVQCNEHNENIEDLMLKLETSPDDPELIDGIFRAIHSIKGDSGFLYLQGITTLAHDTETLLDRVRTQKIKATGVVIELFLESVDALKQMIANLNEVAEKPDPVAAAKTANLELVIFGPIRKRIQEVLDNPSLANAPLPKLGEILVTQGDITQDQLQDALALQGAPLGEVLTKTGVVEPSTVDKALKKQKATGGGSEPATAKAIKVDTDKIDLLVNLVGELVIIESQVTQMATQTLKSMEGRDDRTTQIMEKNLSQLGKITKELQDRSMALRMMPIKQTFQRMTRLVRDASKKMGKKVNLVLRGEDTELDKTVVEQIGDPLVHMLRNSVDHGIEPLEVRRAAGKPDEGTVNLEAYYLGDRIVIRVVDDGKGLDPVKLIAKAVENGLVKPGTMMPDEEAFMLIFAPGFSMAKEVTDISGRGVGMDVVRRNIEKLRGKIEIESTLGVGTIVTISLPLTLAIIDGMIVCIGDEEYIIPTSVIKESFQPSRDAITTVAQKGELINVRGDLTPLVRMYNQWNIKPRTTDPCEALVVIVENNGKRACLMVDELVGKQQIVIKNLGEHFSDARGLAGATILGSGRVGLIVDVDGIMRRADTR